jgi:hypothetical protein
MRYYIYGNWPEMDLQNAYPPTLPLQSEIDEFHDMTSGTSGGFSEWWEEYQDLIIESRPDLNTRLIPAGMIISKILQDVIPNQIPFDELYEDSAPHGRANIYFLAGMITYMALYEENIPSNYMPSDIISPIIRTNLEAIRDFTWQELNGFNFENGDSRVFYNALIDNVEHIENKSSVKLIPNPAASKFRLQMDISETYEVSILQSDGTALITSDNLQNSDAINIENLSSGMYIVRIKAKTGTYHRKLIKE